MLDMIKARNVPPIHALPVAEGRAMALAGARPAVPPPLVGGVTDRAIPGPSGEMPVRIFTPTGAGPFPLLVYFHGGGFVLPNLPTHDALCQTLCSRAGCVVVSVEYRLAPEDRFPAAPDDSLAATRWAAADATALGADPTRIAVGGDSSGGNLAIVTALRIRDEGGPKLRGQLLFCPATDLHAPATPSSLEYAEGYGMARETLIWFYTNYLNDASEADLPHASPLLASSPDGLPPALVITAEYDVLRDEGERYAERLRAAGVATTLTRHAGMIHGFFVMLGRLDQAQGAVDEACEWLAGVLRRDEGPHAGEQGSAEAQA